VIEIQQATPDDLLHVLELLRGSGLPVDGLSAHRDTLLVARDGERVVGSAALELYRDSALLRSVAVEPSARGSGLGQRLTRSALELARRHGVRDVFLLTTTAENFFPRFGFELVTRDVVPDSVSQSVEFTSACPASAIVLRHRIAGVA